MYGIHGSGVFKVTALDDTRVVHIEHARGNVVLSLLSHHRSSGGGKRMWARQAKGEV